MKVDRMGVYLLMAHLIITIAIIAVYSYTIATGQGDETLKTILTVIIGYWFGSMGANAIRPSAPKTTVNHANEVKVEGERTEIK